jgi:hypothetical protein
VIRAAHAPIWLRLTGGFGWRPAARALARTGRGVPVVVVSVVSEVVVVQVETPRLLPPMAFRVDVPEARDKAEDQVQGTAARSERPAHGASVQEPLARGKSRTRPRIVRQPNAGGQSVRVLGVSLPPASPPWSGGSSRPGRSQAPDIQVGTPDFGSTQRISTNHTATNSSGTRMSSTELPLPHQTCSTALSTIRRQG